MRKQKAAASAAALEFGRGRVATCRVVSESRRESGRGQGSPRRRPRSANRKSDRAASAARDRICSPAQLIHVTSRPGLASWPVGRQHPSTMTGECVTPYAVHLNDVSTVSMESSTVAAALAGLRAHEARYVKSTTASSRWCLRAAGGWRGGGPHDDRGAGPAGGNHGQRRTRRRCTRGVWHPSTFGEGSSWSSI
jgi:hypothetical protein